LDTLVLEDVRCFHARHELRLAPLTILVGENSTGKSTLLAAARLAWDIGHGVLEPDFNEEPFDWGAYDQIAHFRGGRGGRAQEFTLGYTRVFPDGSPNEGTEGQAKGQLRVEATFAQVAAQPRIRRLLLEYDSGRALVEFNPDATEAKCLFSAGGKRSTVKLGEFALFPQSVFLSMLRSLAEKMAPPSKHPLFRRYFAALGDRGQRPYAIAPIRTKPERTYNRRMETPRPEGDHVPMILARLRSSESGEGEELWKQLRAFGAESGLFRNVEIKRLGRKESDPFQVEISIVGPSANLVDVGYGVSQVLPIAVDCLRSQPGQLLLMQQPEVHLHPRAQAQLGTFLAHLVKHRQNRFVIETHSDYLIDRIRLDIRDGDLLKPEDVSLLYCERSGVNVTVKEIQIDGEGNLVDAPRGYRKFFLQEEKRFFEG
jgi:hypothetical protein